ncbi:MAG: hypothetical protein AABX89_07560 [Candidatus Thermoplasmatota archaeon]
MNIDRPVATLIPTVKHRVGAAVIFEDRFRLLLGKPGTMLIVLALLERGPLSRRGLMESTGMSWGGASYHTKALERCEALLNRKTDEGVRLCLTDPASTRRLLDSLHPGWSIQPIMGGALWKRLQERVQQRRLREYDPWYRRESVAKKVASRRET